VQEANSSEPDDKIGKKLALRVIIAGGGTGGHLFPAIAIAREFTAVQPKSRICFVSTGNDFERSTLSRAGFPLQCVTAEGIKGQGLWRQLRAAIKVPMGVIESIRILKQFRPDLVVGVGSYASGPVAMGAWLMGTRIVLHEQNILPGITNRILSRFADRVYVSFEKTCGLLTGANTFVTGNPVRREFIPGAESHWENGRKSDSQAPFTVVIVGGSQGAHSVNTAVMDAVAGLRNKEGYFFIHQTGSRDTSQVKRAYEAAGVTSRINPFFDDLATRYRMADLVICRAGATTVAEITALGKAVIFIPFPHAADNHQVMNARSLSDRGAARMIEERDLTGARLCQMIEFYASNREALSRMGTLAGQLGHPGAAVDIVKDCYRLLDEKPKRG